MIRLPPHCNMWDEVKRMLTVEFFPSLNPYQIVLLLERIEQLLHLGKSSSSALAFCPQRTTFFGLGQFVCCCLSEQEKIHFLQLIFPFIVQSVIATEDFRNTPLFYCTQRKECDVVVHYRLATSLTACAVLCLLPRSQEWQFMFSEPNLISLYTSIRCRNEAARKFKSFVSYFDYCRLNEPRRENDTLCFHRRRLTLEYPDFINLYNFIGPSIDSSSGLLPYSLADYLTNVRLPCVFVDRCHHVDVIADTLCLPTAYLVNSYLDGDFQTSVDDSPFSLYPDLLVPLSLCHRLDDLETIWVDRCRGPFSSAGCSLTRPAAGAIRWRRFIFVNSGDFPSWASAAQFNNQYITSEVMNATAAYFGVCATETNLFPVDAPFSERWWTFFNSKISPDENSATVTSRFHNNWDIPGASPSSRLIEFAGELVNTILREVCQSAVSTNPLEFVLERSISGHRDARLSIAHRQSSTSQSVDISTHSDRDAFETVTCATRQSFSATSENMSVFSACHSSTRSSISQGRSFSTQSSLRRHSDLSSSDGSWLSNVRPTEGIAIPGLRELVEHETELESPNNVEPTVNQYPVNAMRNAVSLTSESSDNVAACVGDQFSSSGVGFIMTRHLTHPIVSANCDEKLEPELENFATHWTSQILNAACLLAAKRTSRLNRLAEQLTHSVVRQAVFQAHNLGRLGAGCITGTSEKTALTFNTRRPISSQPSTRNISDHGVRASNKRQNYRWSRLVPYISGLELSGAPSEKPTVIHSVSPRNSPVSGNSLPNKLIVEGRREPVAAASLLNTPTVHVDAFRFPSRSKQSRKKHVNGKTDIRNSFRPISDRLARYAESVATECCVKALQDIRLHRTKSAADDSGKRPPGLVTSGHMCGRMDSPTDPQLKIMVQWIAAAVAGSVTYMSQSSPSIRRTVDDEECQITSATGANSQCTLSSRSDLSEFYISPIVICTNNDPGLVQLSSVIDRIYASKCTAGSLLASIYKYAAYRSDIAQSCGTPSKSVGNSQSTVLSLFDFLLATLPSTAVDLCKA